MPVKNKTLVQIGQRIRDRRESVGLSQEALADLCGLHRTYIGSIERGERNLSILNLITIARALKFDVGHLVKGLQSEATRHEH